MNREKIDTKWRSLVRFKFISPEGVFLEICGASFSDLVFVSRSNIPDEIFKAALEKKDDRRYFHVSLTLGVATPEEVEFDHNTWEFN